MGQPVYFFNTLSRQNELFQPLEEGRVKMYCCGPTVYNFAHIGNLRTYIFEDLLHRVLEDAGYRVDHVVNVTDVGHLTSDGDAGEDKMIKSARERGMSVWDIAEFFTQAFFHDWEALRLRPPGIVCKATQHVTDMIEMIKRLEEKGFTYQAGGNVYFDTSKFPQYGKLALLDRQKTETLSRVESDVNKRNPRDFVLWFTQSKFADQAMIWDSPWGRGYPGWHIECSAMSSKYLGEQFDIHCGGVDHIPVHHTNEIAQSEAAFGHPWVNYWLHGEFLVLQKEKMSKSSGEFLTLSVLREKGFDPMDYRYFVLNAHYRTQLVFSFEALDAARNGRLNLLERVRTLSEGLPEAAQVFQSATIQEDDGMVQQIRQDLRNDLNSPKALATMWTMVKDPSIEPLRKLRVLGWLEKLLALGMDQAFTAEQVPPEVVQVAEERLRARKDKNWSLSDQLRGKLETMGWSILDQPDGYRLKKKV
jgi:cysteinyl-tRNA synthetase